MHDGYFRNLRDDDQDERKKQMNDNQMNCWLCGSPAALDETYSNVPLYRCTNCDFLFAPQRDVEELHDLYDDSYFENYGGEQYGADEQQREHEAALRRAWIGEFITAGRLLEIGSTNGTFLAEMRNSGFDVTGVEPAPGLATFAREKRDLDVRIGFVEDVELPEEKFDVVCAWHVLEHITKPQGSLKRLREASNDDGWLFLEIPNIKSIKAGKQGMGWQPLEPVHHVAFYDHEQLDVLMEQSGYKLHSTESVSGFTYLRASTAARPDQLAARALEITQTGTISRTHPWKHELLRVIARPV